MDSSEKKKTRRVRRDQDTAEKSTHARRTPMSTGNEPNRTQVDGDETRDDGGIERESPIGDVRDDRDVERERP